MIDNLYQLHGFYFLHMNLLFAGHIDKFVNFQRPKSKENETFWPNLNFRTDCVYYKKL